MFTFANPLLLWAFPVLALPWIFRRRQEERIRHVNFPLIQFLRESEEKELVNPQLQELLLILLRTLLLAVLIFALAGPKWISITEHNSAGWMTIPFAQTFQNHVIAIDSSYSMGYDDGEQSWWRATQQTWNSLNQKLAGFTIQTVAWDNETMLRQSGNQLIPLSNQKINEMFSSVPTHSGSSILNLIDALKYTFPDTENFICITDGQRLPWLPLLENPGSRSFPYLTVVLIGREPVSNLWLEVDALSSPPWGIAGWETVSGTVRSLSNTPVPQGSVSILRADTGERVFSKQISLPAAERQPIELPFEFTANMTDLIEASSSRVPVNELEFLLKIDPDDPLPVDNQIELRIPLMNEFTVQIPHNDDATRSVFSILSTIVSPLADRRNNTGSFMQPSAPRTIQLEEQPDLILFNPMLVADWLSVADVSNTLEYIKNGGSAIVFTGGDPNGTASWVNLLQSLGWSWLDGSQQNPNNETLSVSDRGLYSQTLAMWNLEMWQRWLPERHGTLQGSSVIPYITYRVGDQTVYLLAETKIGNGRVWIVNASLDPTGNVLLSPILPALIWETEKEIARAKSPDAHRFAESKEESNIGLLTDEEREILSSRYGIQFVRYDELNGSISTIYGGANLRVLFLFLCLLIALVESWLSNRLASL